MAIELNPTAERVRQALEAADGDVSQAARALGLSRQYLHRVMREYRIRIVRQVIVDESPSAGSTAAN